MTLNRRPIAGLAICFLAGSAVGSFLPGQAFLGVFFLSFVLVAVGVVCSSFRAVLFLATFTIGAANMVSTIPGVAPRDVQELFKPGDEHIALTGMISSEVVPRQSPYRNEIVYRIPVATGGNSPPAFLTAGTRERSGCSSRLRPGSRRYNMANALLCKAYCVIMVWRGLKSIGIFCGPRPSRYTYWKKSRGLAFSWPVTRCGAIAEKFWIED